MTCIATNRATCELRPQFFAFVATADLLLVSIYFTKIPILPLPFFCMGRWCLQMMDHFLLSESLQVIYITIIT